MGFLIVPEILEMINKLSYYLKKTESKIQQKYYQNALKDLQKLLEVMRKEQC